VIIEYDDDNDDDDDDDINNNNNNPISLGLTLCNLNSLCNLLKKRTKPESLEELSLESEVASHNSLPSPISFMHAFE